MTIQSRRDFLKYSGASLVLLAGGSLTRWVQAETVVERAAQGREFIALCNTMNLSENSAERAGSLRALDVQSGEVTSVDLPFFGHAVHQHYEHPTQVVTFAKRGPRGALVDLKDKKVLSLIEADKGNKFFGHAVFAEKAELLIATESPPDGTAGYGRSDGKLVLRDVKDLRIVGSLDSHGNHPHECRTLDQGKTIHVVNGGDGQEAGANYCWIDVKSGKLLNKVEFGHKGVGYAHFNVSHDGWVCIHGGALPGYKRDAFDLITFVSPQGEVLWPELPHDIHVRLLDEALSSAFLGTTGLVAVTVPSDDLLLILDYKKQKLVEALTVKGPKGVLSSLQTNGAWEFVFSSGKNRGLQRVTGRSGKTAKISAVDSSFGGNGSHMARLYI